MIQYLIILLDDTATSYCHYTIPERPRRLISLDYLRKGILFAMKENLMVQFVYPNHEVPREYVSLIESVDHIKIVPANSVDNRDPDVIVYDELTSLLDNSTDKSKVYVLRLKKKDLFEKGREIGQAVTKVSRLNIVLTDIESFTEEDFKSYKLFLNCFSKHIKDLCVSGELPQVNILTDRLLLNRMNNCNAGQTNITLAPDGRFYVCPAFYYEKPESVYMGLGGSESSPFSIGDLDSGVNIKNHRLYNLDYAPLCRICDAYQCKRCTWLNWKTTREVNTPSHEQCVVAHLERNASRDFLLDIRRKADFLTGQEIGAIDYLDPFDVKEEW